MCEESWVFPTPRLGRYPIRTGFDFLIFFFGCCWGLIFIIGLIFFYITFKNINNIVKGASEILLEQITKNNILYYILKFLFENLGREGGPLPQVQE